MRFISISQTAFFLLLASTVYANTNGAEDFSDLDVHKTCMPDENILGKNNTLDYKTTTPLSNSDVAVYKSAPSQILNYPKTLFELKNHVDSFFTKYKKPESINYYNDLMKPLSAKALSEIIESVLDDEAALKKIAENSYRHATDFTKITLLEGNGSNDYKVKLNIWWPTHDDNSNKLLVEDKHVNQWDSASRMFAGEVENQIYITRKPTENEIIVRNKFISALKKLTSAEQKKVFNSINMIEMALYKKSIFNNAKYLCKSNMEEFYILPELLEKFSLTQHDFIALLGVYERYTATYNAKSEYSLKELGLEALNPPSLYDITDGGIFVERYQLAHRLISNPYEMTAIIVVSAPSLQNKDSYILLRNDSGEALAKSSEKLSIDELKSELKIFLEYLKAKQRHLAPN